uniref:Endonuclease domain-containing 1 protein n=1 Tax=Chrysemys picta bellii TaxID=8478 RepID=A0A8C3FJM2_CHRPI
MGPLVLLGFASLWAGLVLAEVGPTFSKCTDYFYGGIEPQGFDTNRANICQKYGGTYNFATFYNESNRILVWSAYRIDEGNCTDTASETWKVEPQVNPSSNLFSPKNQKGNQSIKEKLKEKQAINEDYERTHYDRGHLNPNSFQCGQSQIATFTLTNAVPMDPCFNRVNWYELEQNLKMQLTYSCPNEKNQKGKPFLETGAVPNAERVVVLSHIWTAVCCEHSDNNKKFSFTFLGMNRADSILEPMKVTQLNKLLMRLYGNPSRRPIKIFNDDCNEEDTKAPDVLLEITKQLRDTFPNRGNHLSGNKRPQNTAPCPPLILIRKRQNSARLWVTLRTGASCPERLGAQSAYSETSVLQKPKRPTGLCWCDTRHIELHIALHRCVQYHSLCHGDTAPSGPCIFVPVSVTRGYLPTFGKCLGLVGWQALEKCNDGDLHNAGKYCVGL